MKLKTALKFILDKFYKPLILWYLSSDRKYRYRGINIVVKSGVFHPGFFFSTKLFLKYIANSELSGKKLLELGAGTGLISIFAARRGAVVMASDISHAAIENTIANAQLNQVSISAIESDLFERIPPQIFDIIIITPPYYPRDPAHETDYAWYCGRNYEYFEKLFNQVGGYVDQGSMVLMILSEVCEIERIRQIALKNDWHMKIVCQKRVLWEMNFIFKIRSYPDIAISADHHIHS